MDIHIYNPENLLAQSRQTPLERGYHVVRFYVDEHGQLSKHATDAMAEYFYSPSGGTLRDADLNIVVYSARFDKFKGIGKVE